MDHYRRLGFPLVVDAVQLTHDNAIDIAHALDGYIVDEQVPDSDDVRYGINVKTPEGTKRLSEGMYLIRLNGNHFVVPPGEFESKYQKTV